MPLEKTYITRFPATIREMLYILPDFMLAMGYGVILGDQLKWPDQTGFLIGGLGFALMIVRMRFIPNSRYAGLWLQEGKPHPLQPEIDAAYKAGYRVWYLFPRSDATRTDALYRLRKMGYVLTDQKGNLVDASAEICDSPTRRRRSFRLVEREAEDE